LEDLDKIPQVETDGKILGINWYGIELFARLTGLIGGKKPCHEGMSYVVEHICKPICAERECQLVELFEDVAVNGKPVVGVMNSFHSYTWRETLQDTLRSLGGGMIKEEELSGTYYWWDLFCQNQHVVEDVMGSFDRAISQCNSFSMTIPNPAQPIALQRVWCLFEIMSAVQGKNKDIRIFCNPAVKIPNANNEVDIRNAEATVAADKTMILELVEERIEGGCDALNERVRKVLLNGMHKARILQNAGMGFSNDEIVDIEKVSNVTKLGFADIKERLHKHGIHNYKLNGKNKAELIKMAQENGVDLSGDPEPKTEISRFAQGMRVQVRGKQAAYHRARDI